MSNRYITSSNDNLLCKIFLRTPSQPMPDSQPCRFALANELVQCCLVFLVHSTKLSLKMIGSGCMSSMSTASSQDDDMYLQLKSMIYIHIPFYEVLTLEASVSLSLNVGNLTFINWLLIPNFNVSLPHPRSTTASFKTKLSFNDITMHILNSFCYLSHNRLHLRP